MLGCERMAAQAGDGGYRAAASVIFAVLVAVWIVVSMRTLVHFRAGRLTVPPA